MTHNPQDWHGEFVWMVIYFSLAFTRAPLDWLEEDCN